MKKTVAILFITICIANSLSFSQNAGTKKLKYCSVRLIRMDGNNEKFILGGFSGDSIWGYLFDDSEKKKLIKPGKPLFVKSADIKRVFIKLEKGILLSVKSSDSIDLKKFNSSLIKDNIKNAAINNIMFDGVGSDAATLFSFPELGFVFLAFDLLLPPKGKWYYIKGKEKRFDKMAKDFMKKTSNS